MVDYHLLQFDLLDPLLVLLHPLLSLDSPGLIPEVNAIDLSLEPVLGLEEVLVCQFSVVLGDCPPDDIAVALVQLHVLLTWVSRWICELPQFVHNILMLLL